MEGVEGLKMFPPEGEVESIKVLKALPKAHQSLGELKGLASTIPNQAIIINALVLQEAKDSSAIENIITTHDELYLESIDIRSRASDASKEVKQYASALRIGYQMLSEKGLITNRLILSVQNELEGNNAGYRKLPGTQLRNAITGDVVYTPPQHPESIEILMKNLEEFINGRTSEGYDPLVKMALIHYQFESIHPFYDGNGRTGRIINILSLIKDGLLDQPILYLSGYIIRHKAEYYDLLRKQKDSISWEEWLLYMIEGVKYTSDSTIQLIKSIKASMQMMKHKLKTDYKFYSQELLDNLYAHPYTKIEFVEAELGVSRVTAARYLDILSKDGILSKQKKGVQNYYVNIELFNILKQH